MLPDVPLVTMAETPSLVGHVHLTVRELDRSGAFYRERRHGAGTGWAVAGTAGAVDAGGVDVAVAGVFRRAGARVCGVLVTAATSPSSPRSAAAPSPSNSSGPPTASRRPLVNPRSSHTVGQQYVNKRWSSRAKNRGRRGFLELWLANILSDSISTMSDDVHKLVDQFRLDSTGNATVDEVPDT